MPDRDKLYVGHMLSTARRIAVRTAGLAREEYDRNEDLQIVFTHLVQVIGEAAARVSEQTRTASPQIPWRQITGMRNRLVHDYLNVDLDILWIVVTDRIPELIATLEQLEIETEGS